MENILDIRNRALKALGSMHSRDRVALCLTYNAGDLTRAVYKITHCEARAALIGASSSENPNPMAWYAEARLAAADVVLQLRLLVNELGFMWNDIVALGEEHHREVMGQVERGERE